MIINEIGTNIENEIVESGYRIVYRTQMKGKINFTTKTCYMPRIKSRRSLYVALHELGHIVNGYIKPIYVGEYLAEKYAHRRMRRIGYQVARWMTNRAKQYVRNKIMRARRRGLQTIRPDIKRWTGLLSINS